MKTKLYEKHKNQIEGSKKKKIRRERWLSKGRARKIVKQIIVTLEGLATISWTNLNLVQVGEGLC